MYDKVSCKDFNVYQMQHSKPLLASDFNILESKLWIRMNCDFRWCVSDSVFLEARETLKDYETYKREKNNFLSKSNKHLLKEVTQSEYLKASTKKK